MLNLSGIDLRTLSVFLKVVEQEGFSAAAEADGASLSKITRDVASIEQRIGLRLCHRGRAGFSLTPEGEEVYRAARKLFENIKDFESVLSTLSSSLPHALDVGIIDNMIANPDCPVVSTLNGLANNNPGLTVNINVYELGSMDQKVRDRVADIGFTTRFAQLAPLRYAPAFIERQALFVSRNCPEFERFMNWPPSRMPESLPYVIRTFGHEGFGEFESAYPFQIRGTGNSLEAVVAAVVAGIGAAILPRHAAQPFEHLVEADLPGGAFDIPFYAIVRRDIAPHTMAAKLFDRILGLAQ